MARKASAVGNNDRCGRCGTKHGGNNHLCPVHDAVSRGCCEPTCNPKHWVVLYYKNKSGHTYKTRKANKKKTNLTGWVRNGVAFGLPMYEKKV